MVHINIDGMDSIAGMIEDNPLVLSSHTLMLYAVQQMNQLRKSCIIVADSDAKADELKNREYTDRSNDRQVVGIFTERDLVFASAQMKDLPLLRLADVMTSPVITLVRDDITDLFVLLQPFRQHKIRHLPIVSSTGDPIGLVSQESLRQALQPTDLLRLRRVEEVMTSQVIQLGFETSIRDVAKQMANHSVSCIIISDANRPVGIITERDIVQFQALQLNFETTYAATVMSTPIYPTTICASLWTANQTMRSLRIRRLVVNNSAGKLAGIITQTDIIRTLDPLEMFVVVETLQRKIEEKTQALEQEINDRKSIETQLQHALFVANAANESKSEFLAHMSRELKTPLTSILGFTELLSTDLTLGSDNRRYLETIGRSSRYLLGLINELLDMANIETGHLQIHLNRCNLNSLIQDLARLFKQRSRCKGLTFEVNQSPDLPQFIITDEKKLRQILINLLSNAIKFTDAGQVKFSAFVSYSSCSPMLTFQIQDTGPGIKPEDQSKIFIPFFQGARRSRLSEGNGLGLPISQQLTQHLGGNINLDCQIDRGSIFTLTLPLDEAQSDIPQSNTPQSNTPQSDTNSSDIQEDDQNSVSWIQKLRQAALLLNHSDCKQILDRALSHSDQDEDAVIVLQTNLDRFDFDAIVRFIDEWSLVSRGESMLKRETSKILLPNQ